MPKFDFPIYTISIHASVWEATDFYDTYNTFNYDPNPRLRMGGDKKYVSLPKQEKIFQSTPPYGRRPNPYDLYHLPNPWFQSTPPYGRRPFIDFGLYILIKNFNPRLRMGGDRYVGQRPMPYDVFQSTPPYGRRPKRKSW